MMKSQRLLCIKSHPNCRYDKDLATMVRVIREFLKIPDTVFTTQVTFNIGNVDSVYHFNHHNMIG